jgi:hypothetical protein
MGLGRKHCVFFPRLLYAIEKEGVTVPPQAGRQRGNHKVSPWGVSVKDKPDNY